MIALQSTCYPSTTYNLQIYHLPSPPIMNYPTLDTADIANKKVLFRAGFDVPLKDGFVQDTTRMEANVPSMKYILDAGGSLIIMAHQGRPKGERLPEFSQKPLVPVLEQLLGVTVQFAEYCTGDETKKMTEALKPGEVLLLENLRYEKGEKSKDAAERDTFGKELASLADVYVNDAFTNCHRDHASMTAVPKYIPGYIGFTVQKEVEGLSKVTNAPKAPVTLIVSGAKIETKVPVIEQFLTHGDDILVGGCIANTLAAAQGYAMGGSKYDEEFVDLAKELLAKGEREDNATIHVPTDFIAATEISESAEATPMTAEEIAGDMAAFDIGPQTMDAYVDHIRSSKTIVWNGPLGLYEIEQFAGATKRVAEAVREATQAGAVSVIGGGDTLDFHDKYGISMDGYTFVSTAGGAMLDYISGKTLPALEVLK